MKYFYLYKHQAREGHVIKLSKDIVKNNLFDEFYKLVGCRILERIPLTNNIDILCDEEGLLRYPVDINIIKDMNNGREVKITGDFVLATINVDGKYDGLNNDQLNYLKNINITTVPIKMSGIR
ncbi:DUF3846 domain-containing protein [Staphylococcus hyicus]|uniref:DUF3846 domain-containing protein n=1 Tax=Staphylococcus hyicus TaxID=1284 RepID=UPI00313332D1